MIPVAVVWRKVLALNVIKKLDLFEEKTIDALRGLVVATHL